jgi:uncharacterized protein YwgA
MSRLDKRIAIIARILELKKNLGKTAIMKIAYILQEVYHIPLGYDFTIYTYGPYSAKLMEDIDYGVNRGFFSMSQVQYSNGVIGYQFDIKAPALETEMDYIEKYDDRLRQVVDYFGEKSAKELELESTIIYQYKNYTDNHWENSVDKISESVLKIKPHFDITSIRSAFFQLQKDGYLA